MLGRPDRAPMGCLMRMGRGRFGINPESAHSLWGERHNRGGRNQVNPVKRYIVCFQPGHGNA